MPITVTTSASPPSADLFLSGLPAGTVRVRVWRVWADQEQRVRGDEQAAVISLETRLVDSDVPVGRPVAYRADCFASDGSQLAPMAGPAAVTVGVLDPETAWLSDPLAPGLSRLVTLLPSDESRTFTADTVFAAPIGSGDPLSISGVRSSASEWTWVFRAFSHEESTAIEALAAPGGVLLVRPGPGIRHATGLIYLSAPTVVERPRYDMVYHQDWSDWVFTGRQCRPPSVSVVMPVREYADVEAESADYQAVVDTFTDYLALLRG